MLESQICVASIQLLSVISIIQKVFAAWPQSTETIYLIKLFKTTLKQHITCLYMYLPLPDIWSQDICSNEKQDLFKWETIFVQMRNKICSNEKPYLFKWETRFIVVATSGFARVGWLPWWQSWLWSRSLSQSYSFERGRQILHQLRSRKEGRKYTACRKPQTLQNVSQGNIQSPKNKLAKPRSYASLKLWLTDLLTYWQG